jgi:hypothetical protein
MFELTGGEIIILGFVVASVVSWPWWPRLGEAVAMIGARDTTPDELGPPR